MGRLTQVDVTHAVRAISEWLGEYAVPSERVPHTNEHNVRVMRGTSERKKQHALFHFETRDGFDLKVDVDLAAFIQDPLAYIDSMMAELGRGMETSRRRRQESTRIVIPGPEGLQAH